LCRSCMPPGHQLAWLLQSLAWLLYLNCNNIIMLLLKLLYLILSLIFFCFVMKNSTPPAPPLARAQPRKPGFLKIAPPPAPPLARARWGAQPPIPPSKPIPVLTVSYSNAIFSTKFFTLNLNLG
jgi:hypothetical protein